MRIDLDDRSLYWEAQSVAGKAGNLADAGTEIVATVRKNKRGRPQTIPDELKAAAAALKASGGSNREAAAKLYSTKYPTSQQVKNVSVRSFGTIGQRLKNPLHPAPSIPNALRNPIKTGVEKISIYSVPKAFSSVAVFQP